MASPAFARTQLQPSVIPKLKFSLFTFKPEALLFSFFEGNTVDFQD